MYIVVLAFCTSAGGWSVDLLVKCVSNSSHSF